MIGCIISSVSESGGDAAPLEAELLAQMDRLVGGDGGQIPRGIALSGNQQIFVSHKDRKAVATALKDIYRAT